MTGAVTYECHLAGARHLKNVENMKIGAPRDTGSMKRKPKGVLPEVTGTRPGRAIFPATKAILDSCTKPLIGMSFITECQVSDGNFEPRYLCQLCQGKCDPRTLLSHILGGKHRIAYFVSS
ncbi:hypothetical protein NP493_285g03039 [Ridgeia piscesae]|uniref:Uncharacterized protein n=1 Tax=Ridgeia piscesae TaxID=27915 RepID=A0AAD9NX35_RIDPI|nr:hypothetical protein NP493_285g03039 [Ridgeia piscesae]